jgi:hypothetical protein
MFSDDQTAVVAGNGALWKKFRAILKKKRYRGESGGSLDPLAAAKNVT